MSTKVSYIFRRILFFFARVKVRGNFWRDPLSADIDAVCSRDYSLPPLLYKYCDCKLREVSQIISRGIIQFMRDNTLRRFASTVESGGRRGGKKQTRRRATKCPFYE